ncbi:AMP deaminase, putative [Trypanosoma equiperdum]|uniref:AMP deaminase, putative n=2 Tax=Trypanozoon TaxID=39700 RepID=Q381L1_TRYB2|nr:AMP deaminase, putative [Trypanosoma brucei brucei TREU927]EAN80520.1 AMP deaminase, putative [Trypanosoma brucei brucei TREU927]SCU70193.1 AMP deaminase, putative [Trypanosoma equiperdum]
MSDPTPLPMSGPVASPRDRSPTSIKTGPQPELSRTEQSAWQREKTAFNADAGRKNIRKNPSSRYQRVIIGEDDGDRDFAKCAEMIANVILARQKYKQRDKGEFDSLTKEGDEEESSDITPGDDETTLVFDRGVYRFGGMKTHVIPWETYVRDVRLVYSVIESGPCLSAARSRLLTLERKSQLFALLNWKIESNVDRPVCGDNMYVQCTRVDNALQLNTSVIAQVVLEFIISTATEQPRTPLFREKGKTVLLHEYLESHGVKDPRQLTVQGLGMHPPKYHNKFQQYDAFDSALNPGGRFATDLLQSFLSTNGSRDGDLLGSIIRPEFEQREFRGRQTFATEMQLKVYGHNAEELEKLAAWVSRQGFNSFTLNSWTICIPRTAPPEGPNMQPITCDTFSDQLKNIFYPMFMATLHPSEQRWVDVALLLKKTGSISILTGSQTQSQSITLDAVSPEQVKYTASISDCYFFYYIWSNLLALNCLRARYDLNTLNFSPSVFERAPMYEQLISSFLLGDVVYHANTLQSSWIMQYLFMYCRIGIVMSPLRDNALSMSYFDHPIVRYFLRGLVVSITTSDPLYVHHSINPLLEEYATLMKLFSMTPMAVYELSRNSVLNSNFPDAVKQKWLGDIFQHLEFGGGDVRRLGACDSRLQFRQECLVHEEAVLNLVLSQVAKKGEQPTRINMVTVTGAARTLDDDLQQLRNAKRANHTDWRVVFSRIDVTDGPTGFREREAVELLREIIVLRSKYVNPRVKYVDVKVEDVFNDSNFDESLWEYNNYYGVFLTCRSGLAPQWPSFIPPVKEFIRDVYTVRGAVMGHQKLRNLATQRLNLLERKFHLHLALNISKEAGKKEEKEWNNRDFFTAHKVDTNVQTAAGMNARTLLEFFVEKALHHGHDVVFEEDNQPVTLRQVLERHKINPTRITVDELNHLLNTNPQLRTTFLDPDNFMKGRYFAELTKRTLELYQEDAFSFSENRLVIGGKSKSEWALLAHWFDRYGMASRQNRWMISLPRCYRRLRQQGIVRNFGEYLDNIFQPLWEVSLHPAKDTRFHYFLTHVSGMDCVDDETKIDLPLTCKYPHDWNSELNPPYNMYLYYYWANITTLNQFRASRGLSTFAFRPQCGELGDIEHLIGGFLLADGINHGVTLRNNPVLEYMYYITQVGVAMSPLSNTAAASEYLLNPFPLFFRRGLNVSLATNQPLYFHFTREPLIEEYSIAAKLWKFEFNDLSEIARNSVLQSGFPHAWKKNALGNLYYLNSTLGNDARKSRVSDIRVAYRYEAYHEEMNFLSEQLDRDEKIPRAMTLLEEEIAVYEKETGKRVDMPSLLKLDDGSLPKDPPKTVARLREEVEYLQRKILHSNSVISTYRKENNCIVEHFNRIRSRLASSSFVVMGNLSRKYEQMDIESSDERGNVASLCNDESRDS